MSSKLKLLILRKIVDVYHTPKLSFLVEEFSTTDWNYDMILVSSSIPFTPLTRGNNWDINEVLINNSCWTFYPRDSTNSLVFTGMLNFSFETNANKLFHEA